MWQKDHCFIYWEFIGQVFSFCLESVVKPAVAMLMNPNHSKRSVVHVAFWGLQYVTQRLRVHLKVNLIRKGILDCSAQSSTCVTPSGYVRLRHLQELEQDSSPLQVASRWTSVPVPQKVSGLIRARIGHDQYPPARQKTQNEHEKCSDILLLIQYPPILSPVRSPSI